MYHCTESIISVHNYSIILKRFEDLLFQNMFFTGKLFESPSPSPSDMVKQMNFVWTAIGNSRVSWWNASNPRYTRIISFWGFSRTCHSNMVVECINPFIPKRCSSSLFEILQPFPKSSKLVWIVIYSFN